MASLLFVLLGLLCPFAAAAGKKRACPHCGGALTTVAKLPADQMRNLDVRTDSICPNYFYKPTSLICKRCWHARSELSFDQGVETWMRTTSDKVSFHRPLAPAFRNLPALPGRGGFNYHQIFVGRKLEESATAWAEDKRETISKLESYCKKHSLALEIDRPVSQPGQIYVEISQSKPRAESED